MSPREQIYLGVKTGVSLAVFVAIVALSQRAEAHLLPANHGTVNLVDKSAFSVLSVPTSALTNVDDNHDGWVDMTELQRHEAQIRDEIDHRFVITDGETSGVTVRIDLVLSPQHDAASDRADQIVALKHTQFTAPPTQVRVHCDLYGNRDSDRELSIHATRVHNTEKQGETAVLSPGAPEHSFFRPVGAQPSSSISSKTAAWAGALFVGLMGVVSIAGARSRRSSITRLRPRDLAS